MREVLEWSAIFFGFASAALWLLSAFTKVPRLKVPFGGKFNDNDPWVVATQTAANYARWASGITFLAVAFQTLAALAEKLSN